MARDKRYDIGFRRDKPYVRCPDCGREWPLRDVEDAYQHVMADEPWDKVPFVPVSDAVGDDPWDK